MNYPLFVDGMAKAQIRHKFHRDQISYFYAIELLRRLGFTLVAADEYLRPISMENQL